MLTGINQFYEEKSDWINKTGGQTGHYTSLISPAFYSWVFRYSPSIRIVSPAEVCEEYAVKVREAAGAVTGK